MKFNKKISCFISALLLAVMPVINSIHSYAEKDPKDVEITNLHERIDRTEKELDKAAENEQELKNQKNRDYNVGISMLSSFPTLYADSQNTLTVTIKNSGGENLQKPKIKISSLPSDISLVSGSSSSQDLNTITVGSQAPVNYQVSLGKNVKEGTYPISFDFTAKYGTSPENYKDYTTTQTFYIKIAKSDKDKKNNQYKPFLIQNINHPAIINKGDVANLKFTITNPNNTTIDSVKISVVPDEGIVNKTQNVFVENNFPANQSKTFSVQLFGKDKVEKKNYSVKITVEPTNPTAPASSKDAQAAASASTNSEYYILPTATQYTGIFYNAPPKDEENDGKGVKNPQIMITNYSYGGQAVQPNSTFPLTMTFVNTSSQKTLKNIKISLASEENTFIAVNSSNSFYVDSMSPESSVTKTLTFAVKPDAQTKTVSMNIEYIYEDSKANPLTAKDTISIPVMQKTLLSIDDIAKPQDVTEGEPSNISVNFYNLGKTQISNLKITSKGNFTPQGESSYFAGNLDAGKSDSFSLTAIPKDPNHISGSVFFTFDTLDGASHKVEKKFDFKLNPIPMPAPDENAAPVEPPKTSHKKYYIGAGVLLLGIAGFIFKKRRDSKKKKLQELDIDE